MVENTTGFAVDASETVWHIKFVQPGNRFAKELNEKIPELETFIEMQTLTVHAFGKFEQGLKVVFDDEHAPYIPDTMSELKNTLYHIKDRIYESGTTDEQFDLIRAIDSLLDYIDQTNDQPGIEEGFYHTIFDEDRYPENPGLQKIIDKLRTALSNAQIGGTVSGEYKHNHKEIILYTRNINPTVEDYLSVFAHEFFHAFHHFYLDEMRSREKLNKYYHSVVLESLATFFQIKFLYHIKLLDKADELQRSIRKHSPIFYPYSGCRDLLNRNRDFIRVFELHDDFEQALKNLVTWREAEIILKKDLKKDKKHNIFNDDVLNSGDIKGASVNISGRKGGNSSRDNTKYDFNGLKKLSKGKTVYEVVKKYVEDNPTVTEDELRNAFPDSIRSSDHTSRSGGVIKNYNDENIDISRFSKPPISLSDSTQIGVSNQFTLETMNKFIEKAKDAGYTIIVST